MYYPNAIPNQKVMSNTLINLGNAPNLKGFHYLKECIESTITNFNQLHILYNLVAQKHNVSQKSIQRAIRFSIINTWRRRNQNLSKEIFGYICQNDYDYPTNEVYITAIAEWIRYQ